MKRYFLELSYKGTNYSGFQTQQNANTIQAEVEKAFQVLQKHPIVMTGSSRTDAGVHAVQNFFHFDYDGEIHPQFIYKINAILPGDIVANAIRQVSPTAHCRFDAQSREYKYFVYRRKDPFLEDRAYYFPYKLDIDAMQQAASIVKEYTDFTSFSKRNTQAKTFDCSVSKSEWIMGNDGVLLYNVVANRFLRGMVRALTATILKVGRQKLSLNDFRSIIEAKDCTKANFSVPAKGLFLVAVNFPEPSAKIFLS